jgi:hypothetical protein
VSVRSRFILLAVPFCLAPASRAAAQVSAPAAPVASSAAIEAIRADVRFLAADALAGRLTGSPGADSAAEYIARRFRQVGLQAPPGGWFQRFTVARTRRHRAGVARPPAGT